MPYVYAGVSNDNSGRMEPKAVHVRAWSAIYRSAIKIGILSVSKNEADSALSYLSCRLTRLLILLHKPSQHVTRKVYTFVPTQKWDRNWTDEKLYEKYGITPNEIEFIEKVVRPMGETNE